MAVDRELYDSVIAGDAEAVKALTLQALNQGLRAEELLRGVLIPAMTEVGQRFERMEFFVPDMLIAARSMRYGMEVLQPYLVTAGVKPIGTVVLGTVAGDLHDIGKNLVGMMVEGAGFRVIDLGADVSPEKFVQAVREHSPQIVGMSALLTTTMLAMKATIEALRKAGLREERMVMVGGAPVTQQYAEEIGADLYAPDAGSAARMAKERIQGTS